MATDPSDWDPLPEAGASQYPGETARLQTRSAAKPAVVSATAPSASEDHVTLAPSEQLLPLQRSTRDPDGDLASLMRAALPRKAMTRPAATATAAPVSAAPSVDTVVAGDPREREKWFLAMPVLEQDRLRRAWNAPAAAIASAVGANAAPAAVAAAPVEKQQEMLEWFWVAYVVFFVAALPLMLVEGLAGFVRMAMAGCVTGMLWQMVPRTRFNCVTSAVGVYCALAIVPRLGELSESLFDALVALGGACIVGYLASLALSEELHRRPTAA